MENYSVLHGSAAKMDCPRTNKAFFCQNPELNMDSVFLYSNVSFGIIRSIFDLLYQNSLVILAAVITGMLMFILYRSYISPDFYTKELTEIGFDHVPPGPDRPLRIARTMTSRRLGSKIPPPYPNGWFAVAESCDVKVGGVLAVDALGQNLCVYRGADGVVRCVDAYCPHLGANLAAGGNVCGNCIECPFHKWRFGADGALVSVPGVESVPKGVSIKSWETVEADGAVWIWYDAENRPPLWPLQDACTMQMRCRGRNIFSVNCHIQEIPENGADVAHLNAVHSESLLSKLGEKYPLLLNFIGSHYWTAEWSRGDHHTSTIKLTHDYKLMKMNLFHVDVDVTQIGPGHVRLKLQTSFGPVLISQSVTPIGPLQQKVVHRVFSPNYNAPLGYILNRAESYQTERVYRCVTELLKLQTSFGPVLISQSVTPIGPLQQKVVHRVFSPNYNAPLGYILNRAESYQFERDVAIWNNKRYVGAPAYVRTDKTIRAFRSWFSQFYSENSISFKDANNSMLEW